MEEKEDKNEKDMVQIDRILSSHSFGLLTSEALLVLEVLYRGKTI